MRSSIPSRAGLFTLIFTLIVTLVAAAPIPSSSQQIQVLLERRDNDHGLHVSKPSSESYLTRSGQVELSKRHHHHSILHLAEKVALSELSGVRFLCSLEIYSISSVIPLLSALRRISTISERWRLSCAGIPVFLINLNQHSGWVLYHVLCRVQAQPYNRCPTEIGKWNQEKYVFTKKKLI